MNYLLLIFLFLLLVISILIILSYCYYLYFKNSFIKNLISNSVLLNSSLGPIEYTLKGENGPVLLYIHGTPGGYDQTIEPTHAYRVLTPSRPGFLRTPLSVGKTPNEQAKAYKELIDHLNIDKVLVMGVSGGGPSSLEFAARYPEKTLGLISFEAVSYSEDFTEKDAQFIQSSDIGLWVQLILMSFFGDEKLASIMFPNPKNRERLLSDTKKVEDLKRVIWSVWPLSMRREGLINDYEQFTNLSAPLEVIKSPTLVIHGDEDISVDIDHAKESLKRIENSELFVVKEGDHMMHATHPEEIEAQIEAFVVKVSADYKPINTS